MVLISFLWLKSSPFKINIYKEKFSFSKYINLMKGFAPMIYSVTGFEMATWNGQIKMH